MFLTISGCAIQLLACNWLVTRILPTQSQQSQQSQHDYTVSQIISGGFQIYLIGIALYMMYIQSTSSFLFGIMFGYFLYDLVNLVQKPFGRTMYAIHGHHIGSILFMGHLYLYTPYDPVMYPIMLLILESSSLLLNVVGLLKQIADPVYHKVIQLVTVVLYGISRIVMFPLWIYVFGRQHMIQGTFDTAIGIAIGACVFANSIFAVWFYKLLLKYLKK